MGAPRPRSWEGGVRGFLFHLPAWTLSLRCEAPGGLEPGRLPRAAQRVPAGPGSGSGTANGQEGPELTPLSDKCRKALSPDSPPPAGREASGSLGKEGERGRLQRRGLSGQRIQNESARTCPFQRAGAAREVQRAEMPGTRAWARGSLSGKLAAPARAPRRHHLSWALQHGGGQGVMRAQESCVRAARGRCGPRLRPRLCSGGPVQSLATDGRWAP
ncbi:uncharacterized protein LOC116587111 [Mustela erminea]|uniref:uncharacterized protein LOC116587111 n=1 Tax=Mustela erminea TaxID=36723 RepID=UPI0013873F8D|nr:uncharacterized protein LOC116587111 [Mustela erminea]